ncbi:MULTISPECIES: hypothetical protein [Rhodopirellula]|uniref:hypothetical protein n=1 Tax=Rhodopirellula TaxID=265488 RepID=UPI00257C744A|nr:hypothetical protein [Rhodopirellula sp. UBA1907]
MNIRFSTVLACFISLAGCTNLPIFKINHAFSQYLGQATFQEPSSPSPGVRTSMTGLATASWYDGDEFDEDEYDWETECLYETAGDEDPESGISAYLLSKSRAKRASPSTSPITDVEHESQTEFIAEATNTGYAQTHVSAIADVDYEVLAPSSTVVVASGTLQLRVDHLYDLLTTNFSGCGTGEPQWTLITGNIEGKANNHVVCGLSFIYYDNVDQVLGVGETILSRQAYIDSNGSQKYRHELQVGGSQKTFPYEEVVDTSKAYRLATATDSFTDVNSPYESTKMSNVYCYGKATAIANYYSTTPASNISLPTSTATISVDSSYSLEGWSYDEIANLLFVDEWDGLTDPN